ncbi:hypothetical protein, partial [Bartonella sp. TT110JLCBS]|uniref:hypothetical protein n=1 Tax=Bartonella sp. TT110JLCBS TaxID=3243578 RepID=UPI0035CF61B9
MDSSFRKQHTSVSGNRILIDNDGAKEIIAHFENSSSETVSDSNQKPETEIENKQSETESGNREETRNGAND